MTSDTSSKPVDEATPAAHKAARDGNPQQLLEKLPAMLHGVVSKHHSIIYKLPKSDS